MRLDKDGTCTLRFLPAQNESELYFVGTIHLSQRKSYGNTFKHNLNPNPNLVSHPNHRHNPNPNLDPNPNHSQNP